MLVQKKYPKAPYKLHVELTEEEVGRIMGDMGRLHLNLLGECYPRSVYPYLFHLLDAIRHEAGLTPECSSTPQSS